MLSYLRTSVARLKLLAQRQFIRDTLTLQSGQLIVIFVAGATQAILARVLGKDLLGDYRSVIVLFSIVGLLDISGAIAMTRTQLSKAFGAGDAQAARDSLAWFLKINLIVNGALVIFFFIFFSRVGGPDGLLARWLVLTEILDVPYQIVVITLSSKRTMRRLVQLETSRLLINSVCMILAVLTLDIRWLIVVQVGISLLFLFYAIWRYGRIAAEDVQVPGRGVLLADTWHMSPHKYLGQGVVIAIDKNLSAFTVTTLPLLMLRSYAEQTNQPGTLGLFTTALAVVTLPGPLINGFARNLDSYLPFKSSSGGGIRQTFIQATLGSGLIWSIGTLALAVVGPFVLLIFFGREFAPAIPWIYPLLLQSLAVGFGVGVGSAWRTLGKAHVSVIESLIVTALMLPVGYLLIWNLGGYGAAWFMGLQWILNALAGIGLILWFTRKERPVAISVPEPKTEQADKQINEGQA